MVLMECQLGCLKAQPSIAIAPSLTNLSITTGCFPTCWKTSNVVPVPKSKTHSDCTQYRPISLLSVVSKLLEKHLHSYISLHLSVSHPISEKQWGFQSGRSTVSALLTVTHEWFKALDQGHEICLVFFDMRKAFDSVPHKMLLDKLVSYGLDKHCLNWVSSYLCNRHQCVLVGGELSMETRVVSQSSVLGPLLFLIYINDVADIPLSRDSILNLYADDMLLYKIIKSAEDFKDLQCDIDQLNNWVNYNLLSLNPNKCKIMAVSRKRNRLKPPQFVLNNLSLQHVTSFKYLGVLLTSDLSWSQHVDYVCMKARKLIGLLYRGFMGIWIMRVFYSCISLWSVLTWNMLLKYGTLTLSKILKNWKRSKSLH